MKKEEEAEHKAAAPQYLALTPTTGIDADPQPIPPARSTLGAIGSGVLNLLYKLHDATFPMGPPNLNPAEETFTHAGAASPNKSKHTVVNACDAAEESAFADSAVVVFSELRISASNGTLSQSSSAISNDAVTAKQRLVP